ncbi:hypothetical protein COCVIDRAFT_101824, partial [Bipolaris victoriae FI3]
LPPRPPSPTPKPPPTAFIPVVGLPSLPRASPSPLGLSAISRLRLKCVWASDLQQLPCPFASITAPASQTIAALFTSAAQESPSSPTHHLFQFCAVATPFHSQLLSHSPTVDTTPNSTSPVKRYPPTDANRLFIAIPHTGSTLQSFFVGHPSLPCDVSPTALLGVHTQPLHTLLRF